MEALKFVYMGRLRAHGWCVRMARLFSMVG
jgi:hypothetical protein